MTILGLFGCSRQSIIISGYLDKECYYDNCFRDSIWYCKYYYGADDVEKFENSPHYGIVSSNDIKTISEYFANYITYMDNVDFASHYDFDYESQIKEGDYFCIISKERQPIEDNSFGQFHSYSYDVYYFDTQKCILYYIYIHI